MTDDQHPASPASAPPEFRRCLYCVGHELKRDECFYAGRCLLAANDPDVWRAIERIKKI